MSPYWKDKTYKTLLRINSMVSYLLKSIMLTALVIVCIPAFVIIVLSIMAGVFVMDTQQRIKDNLEEWAYGKTKDVHE